MKPDDRAAQQALRARQGAGARYDAANAPHEDLLQARRGTAYFRRKLNELRDEDFAGASRRAAWSRSHLIADASYQARSLASLIAAVRTGVSWAEAPSPAERDAEIQLASTLPVRALRHFFEHSAKHLDVEWRDLPDAGWNAHVTLVNGVTLPLRQTPRLRALELWQAAVDLDNGGRAEDIPRALRAGADAPA